MQVTRKLEWDAAHRVMRHESKCATLHGHRYVAEVSCEALHLDELNRVVDFGVVKAKIGSWIDEHWDHTTLVNSQDFDLVAFCDSQARDKDQKPPYRFQGEPTAEAIAEELFRVASELLTDSDVRVCHVRVHETPNCWADCSIHRSHR